MPNQYMRNEEGAVSDFLSEDYFTARALPERRQNQSARLLKRLFDICISGTLILLFAIPMAIIALAVKLTSKGPVLYRSNRAGRRNQVFRMPKFRTMRVGTPEIATRLLPNPKEHLTPIGSFLRWASVDELPQLFSVFRGDMSLVGPRPVLLNERDLISLREDAGIHALPPGITGWAQVNGRDALSDEEKLRYDHEYLSKWNLLFDLQILAITIVKVIKSEDVAH